MITKIIDEVAYEMNLERKAVKAVANGMFGFVADCIKKRIPVVIEGLASWWVKDTLERNQRRFTIMKQATNFKACCLGTAKLVKDKDFGYFFLTKEHYDIAVRGIKCEVKDLTESGCSFVFPAMIGYSCYIKDIENDFANKYFNTSAEDLKFILKNNFVDGIICIIFVRETKVE